MEVDETKFECQVERDQDQAVLRPRGDIDVTTTPGVRDSATSLIEDGVRLLAVDLSQVDFLDSTGLGGLVVVLKRLRDRNGLLCLFAASERIQNLLSITGLEAVFHVEPDEAAALAYLSAPPAENQEQP